MSIEKRLIDDVLIAYIVSEASSLLHETMQ